MCLSVKTISQGSANESLMKEVNIQIAPLKILYCQIAEGLLSGFQGFLSIPVLEGPNRASTRELPRIYDPQDAGRAQNRTTFLCAVPSLINSFV